MMAALAFAGGMLAYVPAATLWLAIVAFLFPARASFLAVAVGAIVGAVLVAKSQVIVATVIGVIPLLIGWRGPRTESWKPVIAVAAAAFT